MVNDDSPNITFRFRDTRNNDLTKNVLFEAFDCNLIHADTQFRRNYGFYAFQRPWVRVSIEKDGIEHLV